MQLTKLPLLYFYYTLVILKIINYMTHKLFTLGNNSSLLFPSLLTLPAIHIC